MKNTEQKVVIYVKQYCPHCKEAKKLLLKKDVQYIEIDVDKNIPLPEGIKSFKDIKSEYNVGTVPQIFINGEHIGGNDNLQKLNKEGKLDDMLNNNYDSLGVTANTQNDTEYDECGVYATSNDDLM